MHIGERIKRARMERGWTLRDLARNAQVNHAWIARLESGERHNISLEAGARVAVALGLTLDYLAGISTATRNRRPSCEVVSEPEQ
jgi:transcriptional regulator with XRE-family HTH domain